MSPARATPISSFVFGLIALAGLGLAALAVGCQARQPADPESPDQNQTDPAHAEKVDPQRPLGDDGQPDSPTSRPPGEPRPDPQPAPLPDPDQPSPVPHPTPEPAPEPVPPPPDS